MDGRSTDPKVVCIEDRLSTDRRRRLRRSKGIRIERNATRLTLSLRKWTEPSPNRAFTPPGWYEKGSSFWPAWLPAVAVVVGHGTPSFVGTPLLLGPPEVPNAQPGSAHLQ